MIIEIPGYKTLDLDYLVLDYNGTIAVDGLIPPAIKERLLLLHVFSRQTGRKSWCASYPAPETER